MYIKWYVMYIFFWVLKKLRNKWEIYKKNSFIFYEMWQKDGFEILIKIWFFNIIEDCNIW